MPTQFVIDPTLQQALFWLTLVAVTVSAVSGVLAAGSKQFDLFGMIVIALATALGGGSIRDTLLNKSVFWINNQLFLIAALIAGIATFFYASRNRFSIKLFLIPDAIGLATFSIAGTITAVSADAPWLVASFMGVITGTMGGIIRDMMCNQTPVVFKSTLYATVSWFGGILFIAMLEGGLNPSLAAAIAGASIFITRLAAIKWGLTLPTFTAKE